MSKVYFLKEFSKLEESSASLFKNFYPPGSKILIKLHFGEPGNNLAFTPEDVAPVINALKALNLEPILFDTPVVYDSPRNSVEGYEKVVREKGFQKMAPFFISDNGIAVKMKDLNVEACKEMIEAENVLMISHVKGHECSGFGGAIKNFGMGCVTKKSKGEIHALAQPKLVSSCLKCGHCLKICPAKAITMGDTQIEVDLEKCLGCSICQQECPNNSLAPQKALFDDLLAQGAAAVINNLSGKILYINIIKNISVHCDCCADPGAIISHDIGVLFSENPFAADKASVELINNSVGKNLFKEHNHKDPMAHVRLAAKYAQKSMDYEMINL